MIFKKIIESPRMRRRRRVANGEIRTCWRIAQRLDGEHEPGMHVKLHVQLEMSLEAITRKVG